MKPYFKYVEDVKSERVVTCKHIKDAVKRFEDFRAREDMYFDEECVDEAIEFIGQMKHFLGKSAGKNFTLENWQCFILACLLGLKWKDTGYRVCRETYIQIARKAGKDAFMAALALYMMIVDGEASPEIACLANSREQARILFDYVSNFGKSIDPRGNSLKYYRNYVKFPTNNGTVKVFSADASKLDGLNISFAVVDEYHEAKDRKMYDVMKSSMGMRTQPMMVVITTAGFNLESPCHDMYMLSLEILAGIKTDDTFFPFLFVLDEGDDWEDSKNFIKVQPNLGVTVTSEFMEGEVLKAKNDATAEVGVKTKTLNMWCQAAVVWIPQDIIVKSMKKFDIEDYAGYTCYLGCDLGSVSDFTSLTCMIAIGQDFYFKTWTFIPNETYKTHPNRELYKKFVQEGSMTITPGNVCDYDLILKKIQDLNQIVNIAGIWMDTWNATAFQIKCTELGYNVQPFSQAVGNYNACTKEFERLVKEEHAVIDKSSNIVWQFGNVELKMDWNGNVKPNKAASGAGGGSSYSKKIDSVISMTTALGGYLKSGGNNNDFEIYTLP